MSVLPFLPVSLFLLRLPNLKYLFSFHFLFYSWDHMRKSCETFRKQVDSKTVTLSCFPSLSRYPHSLRHSFSEYILAFNSSHTIFCPPTHSVWASHYRNRGGPGVSHWLPHRPFVQGSWQSFYLTAGSFPTSTIPMILYRHMGCSARKFLVYIIIFFP